MQRSDDMAFYTCPRCGQNNPDTLTACSKCGMPLSEFFPDTKPPVQSQNTGGYYGTGSPTAAPYGNTSQNMNAPYMPYPPNYGQGMPPKRNNTLVIVLIIVIIVLVIAGTIITVMLISQSGGNGGNNDQTSQVSETASPSQSEASSVPYQQSSLYTPSTTYSEPSSYTPSTTYSEPSSYTPSTTYSEPSSYTPSTTYSEPSADTSSETDDGSGIDVDKYIPYMKQKSQWSYFNDSRYANPNYKIPTPESCITTIKKTTSEFDASNEYGLYYTYESADTEDVIAYVVLLKALDYDFMKYESSDNPDQSFFYFSKGEDIVLSFTIRTLDSQGTVGIMVVRGDYE